MLKEPVREIKDIHRVFATDLILLSKQYLSGKCRRWRLIVEKLIKEKISSLLSNEEEVLSVEQLGGMTNQNYLVKTTNKQYIVEIFW